MSRRSTAEAIAQAMIVKEVSRHCQKAAVLVRRVPAYFATIGGPIKRDSGLGAAEASLYVHLDTRPSRRGDVGLVR